MLQSTKARGRESSLLGIQSLRWLLVPCSFNREWEIIWRSNFAAKANETRRQVPARLRFFFILRNLLWRQELESSSVSQNWWAREILHIINMDGPGNEVFWFGLGNIFDYVIIFTKITITAITYGLKHVITLMILIEHAFLHTNWRNLSREKKKGKQNLLKRKKIQRPRSNQIGEMRSHWK